MRTRNDFLLRKKRKLTGNSGSGCGDRRAPHQSSIMVVVPMMTVMPIATNPEHAIDATHHAADTGADRAANDGAHRTCRAATIARALVSAALHAADDALRMAGMGHREQRESKCCG